MPAETPPEPRRSTPPGEGWDDGRGNRPAKGERSTRRRGRPQGGARPPAGSGGRPAAGGARRPASSGERAGLGGVLGGLPRWLLPAVGAFLVLVIVLVVVFRGGGGSSNAGSCLTELSAALPEADRTTVYGSDLVQARSEGYVDDAELEELGTTQAETGAIPDPLTQEYRYGQLISAEAVTAKTGVEPGQVRCVLSDVQRSVMSGSFDVAEVSGSSVADDGRLAASEERLGYTYGDADPKKLLTERDGGGLGGNDDFVRVLESLRDADAYSVLVDVGNPRAEKRARAAGVGVGKGEGDDRTLVVAWAYADGDAAKAGRADVVDQVNDVLAGVSEITADDLQVDGSLVTATIQTRKAADLQRTLQTADPLIETD